MLYIYFFIHYSEVIDIKFIREQINIIKEKDPSIHSVLEAILTPGFRALLYYKISNFLY